MGCQGSTNKVSASEAEYYRALGSGQEFSCRVLRCKLKYKTVSSATVHLAAQSLHAKGYTAQELLSAGFALDELRVAGVSVPDLRRARCGLAQLKAAGFSLQQLKEGGATVQELKGVVSLADLGVCFEGPFTGRELKDGGVTAQQLRNAGYALAFLKCAGFTVQELKGVVSLADLGVCFEGPFTGRELKDAGVTAQQLRDAGYALAFLKCAGFSAKELRVPASATTGAGSVSDCNADRVLGPAAPRPLLIAGKPEDKPVPDVEIDPDADDVMNPNEDFSVRDAVSLQELLEAGFSVSDLKDVKELQDAGFSACELKDVGVTASQFRAAGFGADALKEADFLAETLKTAGYTACELDGAGYEWSVVLEVHDKCSHGEKIAAVKLEPTDRIQDLEAAVQYKTRKQCTLFFENIELEHHKTVSECGLTDGCDVQADLSAEKLEAFGSPILQSLRNKGHSVKELKDAGVSAQELKGAGVSAQELRQDGGFGAQVLKDAGFGLKELNAAGFCGADLKTAGYSGQEFKQAGFTAAQLRSAGFSDCSVLKQLGFDARAVKDAGFTCEDMKRAGIPGLESLFSLRQLRNGGFTGMELRNMGFSMGEMADSGFTWQDLMFAGFPGKEVATRFRFLTNDKIKEFRRAHPETHPDYGTGKPCYSAAPERIPKLLR